MCHPICQSSMHSLCQSSELPSADKECQGTTEVHSDGELPTLATALAGVPPKEGAPGEKPDLCLVSPAQQLSFDDVIPGPYTFADFSHLYAVLLLEVFENMINRRVSTGSSILRLI